MNKSESITEISKAMLKFQSIVKQPLKDANNPFFKSKYVPLESVVEVISEACSKVGLSFIQLPCSQDNKIGMKTLIMHESGEFIETEPIYITLTKNDPQGAGSGLTYLRRYCLSAVFGITSDKDDDGNKASEESFKDVLIRVSEKLNCPPQELYADISASLKINKQTKDLTEKEERALISILNKK